MNLSSVPPCANTTSVWREKGVVAKLVEGKQVASSVRAMIVPGSGLVKHQAEAEGLDKQPIKGELGLRVFENVSKEAWKMWLEHSKMLINEYRLDLVTAQAFEFLHTRCEEFFFGEGSALPPDFKPAEKGHGHGHSH